MKPLPFDGPNREILLRALREYSESCTLPTLTPGCPYRVETSTGPGCAEECLDLLAAADAPPPVDEVPLGPGLASRPRRPRPRRGPTQFTRPYDAAEIHQADMEKPSLRDWRPAALLRELEHLLIAQTGTADERLKKYEAIADELDGRGFQTAAIVTDVLANGIAMSVLLRAVAEIAALDGFADSDATPTDAARWTRFVESECATVPPLDIKPSEEVAAAANEGGLSTEELSAFSAIFVRLVQTDVLRMTLAWIRIAPIEDVVSHRFPGEEALRGLPLPPAGESFLPGPHLWLYERFMTTYLDDWHRESLHREWRYLHTSELSPLDAPIMRERLIDEADVAKAIADKEAVDEPPRRAKPVGPFVTLALQFLEENNRPAAAAMFHTLRTWEPRDAEFANNEGFCLLPDEPRRALVALEDAANLGYAPRLVNIANRLVALVLTGDDTGAIALAERAHELILGADAEGAAWLWGLDVISGGDPKTVLIEDLRIYIADVALIAGRKTGDDGAVDRWLERRQLVHQPVGAAVTDD